MSRFFVDQSQIFDKNIIIVGEDVKHIKKVLRMGIGDDLIICDKVGNDYKCEILLLTNEEIKVKIVSREKNIAEPDVEITLFQALPKQGKMELIIQKATELGVMNVVPFHSKYCTAKPSDKTMRWQRVAYEAAKQSGRGVIPTVGDCLSFSESCKELSLMDMSIFCYEKGGISLKQALKDVNLGSASHILKIGIMIGSEGGFSEEEVVLLKKLSIFPVSLGNRILRTETASLAVISAIMYETNNLGGV